MFFHYSYSCGYRKAFEQYVSILTEKYPELHIEGENFNPSGYNMLIAKVLVIKLFIFMLTMLIYTAYFYISILNLCLGNTENFGNCSNCKWS